MGVPLRVSPHRLGGGRFSQGYGPHCPSSHYTWALVAGAPAQYEQHPHEVFLQGEPSSEGTGASQSGYPSILKCFPVCEGDLW
jgi:hypothetical protein